MASKKASPRMGTCLQPCMAHPCAWCCCCRADMACTTTPMTFTPRLSSPGCMDSQPWAGRVFARDNGSLQTAYPDRVSHDYLLWHFLPSASEPPPRAGFHKGRLRLPSPGRGTCPQPVLPFVASGRLFARDNHATTAGALAQQGSCRTISSGIYNCGSARNGGDVKPVIATATKRSRETCRALIGTARSVAPLEYFQHDCGATRDAWTGSLVPWPFESSC